MGSMTGPHADTPRTHIQWVVGPGCTLQTTRGRGWESARPRKPHTQARGALPRGPDAAPTVRKASSQERALWCWWRIPKPALSAPTASEWRAPAARPQRRAVGRGRAPESGRPTSRQEPPPPPRAPSCHSRSAQSHLATARAVGLVTGPHARTPGTHSQWVAGPGRTPQRTDGRAWESA